MGVVAPQTPHMTEMQQEDAFDDNDSVGSVEFKSTPNDVVAMRRMGRRQELVRHFRSISMVSFVALGTAPWSAALFVLTQGLIDGGRPGILYSFFWCLVGYLPVYLSMAEMASMAPIAGAQYHWVSEFAPERVQKPLSYLTGWTSTLAWQSGNAEGMFKVGILTQTIITINDPDYSAPNWHLTVITLGCIVVSLAANVVGHRALPYWQNPVFALHTIVFVPMIVAIWVYSPRADHSSVWSGFENRGGWSTTVLAVLVGQLSGIDAHVGIDGAAHMSEEVQDAPRTVPRVMMINFIINAAFIAITNISLVYHIPDVQKALDDSTGYPGLWVLRQSMSLPWLNTLLAFMFIIEFFSNLAYYAAVTRDLYAFTRDNGFPFSHWIQKIDKSRRIPTNAYIMSAGFSAVLSIIFIGSSVAYYAIISLCTIALLQCYMFSIGCILWRRVFHPGTLPYARFSLGRWGILTNSLAFVFSLWAFFWCVWPQETSVTAANLNWAGPIFGVTLFISMLYYYSGGRNAYTDPVKRVVKSE